MAHNRPITYRKDGKPTWYHMTPAERAEDRDRRHAWAVRAVAAFHAGTNGKVSAQSEVVRGVLHVYGEPIARYYGGLLQVRLGPYNQHSACVCLERLGATISNYSIPTINGHYWANPRDWTGLPRVVSRGATLHERLIKHVQDIALLEELGVGYLLVPRRCGSDLRQVARVATWVWLVLRAPGVPRRVRHLNLRYYAAHPESESALVTAFALTGGMGAEEKRWRQRVREMPGFTGVVALLTGGPAQYDAAQATKAPGRRKQGTAHV